jgi:alkylation response protein AidB-like acyl-CoA dehydrogenase
MRRGRVRITLASILLHEELPLSIATTPTTAATLLTDDMLSRFRQRAPVYDRENRFFDEDFEELRQAGYLTIAVPQEFGGPGLNLAQVMAEQMRLAYFAPATALAVNMHIYWTGVAADLHRMGDPSLDWMLREAAAGEVFAAGHAETGNDLPVLLSTSSAEPVDGGYRISGHKMFGSLTPVWTRLGVHAMDTSDPAGPRIVHAFIRRGTPGYTVKNTWDTLGMRATQSDDPRGGLRADRVHRARRARGGARSVRRRCVRLGAAELWRHLLLGRRARA